MNQRMRCSAHKSKRANQFLDLLRWQECHHRFAKRGAIKRASRTNLRGEPEGVAALNHVQIEHLLPVEDAQVHSLARRHPELVKDGSADLPKRLFVVDPRAQARQLWTYH